jgi:hypothetical protein
VAFWIAVGSVVVMAGWSVATATYFAFRDDLLKGLIARQAKQQYAYEDRLADLRAQIDRTTSRQLLDQEQFERKLDDLARREATPEIACDGAGRHRRSDPHWLDPRHPTRQGFVQRKSFAGGRDVRGTPTTGPRRIARAFPGASRRQTQCAARRQHQARQYRGFA